MDLAKMIDHTNLKAYASEADIEKLCREAKEHGFASVCVNPAYVALASELLDGTDAPPKSTWMSDFVCTVIGFPLGQNTVSAKVFEARDAIENGASEIDYVLNVPRLKAGDLYYIENEMAAIVDLCRANGAATKVIFENCYLGPEDIENAARVALKVKPEFIKTSTGFGTGGATVADVRLMKSVVGDEVKIKAAGGIRDKETALAMIEAGAVRLGCSAGVAIVS